MHFHRQTSDNNFTSLGIEDKVGRGKAKKKTNRMTSWNAVLDEQDLQQDEGVLDDELLADVYTMTAKAAKRDARKKAERLHSELSSELE